MELEQTKSQASKRTLYIIPETRPYRLDLKKSQQNVGSYWVTLTMILIMFVYGTTVNLSKQITYHSVLLLCLKSMGCRTYVSTI